MAALLPRWLLLQAKTMNSLHGKGRACAFQPKGSAFLKQFWRSGTVKVWGIEASPVRAMDALHVACALEWDAELFASADKQQLSAAKKAGLKTQQT